MVQNNRLEFLLTTKNLTENDILHLAVNIFFSKKKIVSLFNDQKSSTYSIPDAVTTLTFGNDDRVGL